MYAIRQYLIKLSLHIFRLFINPVRKSNGVNLTPLDICFPTYPLYPPPLIREGELVI